MTIKECPLLVSLFPLSTAQSLMMLEKLKIHGCEQLESIITDEKRVEESKEEILVDDGDNDNKKYSSMFLKLKALHIHRCPQLEFILPFLSGDLSVLETISIESCDKVKYIFDQFVELGSLKELYLDGWPNFIDIFPESSHPMPLFAKGSSSSLRDGFKAPTQLDPIKCNVFSWTHKCCYGLKYRHKLKSTTSTKIPLVSADQPQCCLIASIWDRAQCFSRQQQILCNITTIKLWNVSKMKSVFILSTARRMLQLETLTIENCDELKHIIADIGDDNGGNNLSNVFPRLKKLHVKNCEQLEYIFGHYDDDHQSHNEIHLHLPELKSLHLEILPSLVAMCPKQYHTTFPSLVKLELNDCIPVASKSIGDFIKCFSGQPQILCNITTIQLSDVSNIKSVFILSTAGRMLQLETLTIENCVELKNIIADIGDDNGGNNLNNVFPRLNELYVRNCEKLEYIFGHYDDHHQSHNEIHLHLPELKILYLLNLPSFVAMSPKQYHTTFPSLEVLDLRSCTQVRTVIFFEDKISVFPRLKELLVMNCEQLEYIFGHYDDDHQSHNEIHLHLPELKRLYLKILPSLVAMCPKQYHTTFPSLVTIELNDCIQVANKSIGDFISHVSSKELSDNVENLLALEVLQVINSKVENGFFLNETNGQQLNLMLQYIKLLDLHVMTYLFVGPKSSVTLQNLTRIDIERCEKLEIMFSTSVVRCFPQLLDLRIEECKELKHIIEDNVEDEIMSNSLPPGTCFPKLKTLKVVNCNKLEFVFPVSICKELHKLKVLMIREADVLQEIFRSKDAQKVEIPNLKVIVFVNLPSLCEAQAIQFQNVEHRLVENCQKLSLTSVSTLSRGEIRNLDYRLYLYLRNRGYKFPEDIDSEDGSVATLGDDLSSSQELLNKASSNQQYLMSQQHPEIMSTNSETRSKPPTQSVSPKSKQESFKTSVEEGTMLVNTKIITSSTHSESMSSSSEHKTSSHEVGYGNLTAETSNDFSVGVEVEAALGHKLTSSQEFLNEPSKVKDDEIRVSEPKPSSTTSSLPSQSISTPYQGNPSQIVDNPSSSSLITWELQQLVSKNHLASENLSLLTDFLVKHPSVRLMDNSLSNRYKGYAYNCLAELLKFLQTHSVLNVLESSRFEFVELLQDARRFSFDRGWLDGVERRALYPNLQVSLDALEKLLHSKQQVTKEIEMLHLKIGIFTQHVEELKHHLALSEANLENISQQEARVLESRAALSAPLGY